LLSRHLSVLNMSQIKRRNEYGGNHQEKITCMLNEPGVHERVLADLMSQGIYAPKPQLKLTINSPSNTRYTLDETDLRKVFVVFGEITNIEIQVNSALIIYKDMTPAYFAQRTLNGKHLPGLMATISLEWHATEAPPGMPLQELSENTFINTKFTSRYEIQIENEREFQVARRLIGPKGCNMKKIVELCTKGMRCQAHDIVKIRLRGRGSGFKEGANHCESDEPLHICISSRYYDKYLIACREIELLLEVVYRDYSEYCRLKGMRDPRLQIKRQEYRPRDDEDELSF
jgi:hypothetical protein